MPGPFSALLPLAIIYANSSLDHAIWYGARALGLVAYGLATISVLFGLSVSTRLGDRVAGRGSLADVHRALALLTVLAMLGHVVLLFLDQYTAFSLTDLLVPFVASYRTFWTALGIVAAYLAGAVYLSFYVRGKLGYRTWRAMHYATFLIFAGASFHGLFAGTDSGTAWATALYSTSAIAVALVTAYRLARGIGPRSDWVWKEQAGGLPTLRALLVGCCIVVIGVTLILWAPTVRTSGPVDASQSATNGQSADQPAG